MPGLEDALRVSRGHLFFGGPPCFNVIRRCRQLIVEVLAFIQESAGGTPANRLPFAGGSFGRMPCVIGAAVGVPPWIWISERPHFLHIG